MVVDKEDSILGQTPFERLDNDELDALKKRVRTYLSSKTPVERDEKGVYRFPVWDKGFFSKTSWFFISAFMLYCIVFWIFRGDWNNFFWGILLLASVFFIVVVVMYFVFPPKGAVLIEDGVLSLDIEFFGRPVYSASANIKEIANITWQESAKKDIFSVDIIGEGIKISFFSEAEIAIAVSEILMLDIIELTKK